ncbi:MAG: PIN domain-containing protein [Deltaproteobacteria bacterium]|jgi:predicted nucleic-acid-binding protein|nr:PIN domain-containing protein [Deltaproteobacteria bacterium]
MMALLDTNILIRFLTSDEIQKFRGVYTLFESLEQGDLRVELKLIVLFQVIFVLKSFYSVPREEIATGMLGILKYKGIIVKEKKIVRRTIELWHDSKLDIVDCYLIACLEGDRQNILYSYDRDFDKFKINRKEP